MKKVLLSDRGADVVRNLRGSIGDYESTKITIADSLSGLIDMMQFGIDDNDVTPFTQDIFNAMSVISDYNYMLNRLNDTCDRKEACFGVESTFQSSVSEGVCIPIERDYPYMVAILEANGIDVSDLDRESVTVRELADKAHMNVNDFQNLAMSMRLR